MMIHSLKSVNLDAHMAESNSNRNVPQPWNKKSLQLKTAQADYSLDFINSDNLQEIEEGIKETTRGIDTANLAIALAIARIDREGNSSAPFCK